MQCRYLDCSNEVSEPGIPPVSRLIWLAADIRERDWLLELPPEALEEIY